MTAQRHGAAVTALALTLASVTPLLADEASATAPNPLVGSRVRVATSKHQSEKERLVGELLAVDGDRLVIRSAQQPSRAEEIPVASVTRFEIYRGEKRSTGTGAAIGAIFAGSLSAGFMYAFNSDFRRPFSRHADI